MSEDQTTQEENKIYHVRIKPYNERKGYKLERYMAFGIRFEEAKGWYRVGEVIVRFNSESGEQEEFNIIEYLRAIRNNNEDPDSPVAFDVCTPEEAKALVAAEKAALEADKAKVDNPRPIDLVGSERKSRTSGDETITQVSPLKAKRGRPPKAKPVVQ